jgi:tetratricopeptide (TPR) repeat protein
LFQKETEDTFNYILLLWKSYNFIYNHKNKENMKDYSYYKAILNCLILFKKGIELEEKLKPTNKVYSFLSFDGTIYINGVNNTIKYLESKLNSTNKQKTTIVKPNEVFNEGVKLFKNKEFKKSLEMLLISEKEFEKKKDKKNVMKSVHILAKIYFNLKDFQKASTCYERLIINEEVIEKVQYYLDEFTLFRIKTNSTNLISNNKEVLKNHQFLVKEEYESCKRSKSEVVDQLFLLKIMIELEKDILEKNLLIIEKNVLTYQNENKIENIKEILKSIQTFYSLIPEKKTFTEGELTMNGEIFNIKVIESIYEINFGILSHKTEFELDINDSKNILSNIETISKLFYDEKYKENNFLNKFYKRIEEILLLASSMFEKNDGQIFRVVDEVFENINTISYILKIYGNTTLLVSIINLMITINKKYREEDNIFLYCRLLNIYLDLGYLKTSDYIFEKINEEFLLLKTEKMSLQEGDNNISYYEILIKIFDGYYKFKNGNINEAIDIYKKCGENINEIKNVDEKKTIFYLCKYFNSIALYYNSSIINSIDEGSISFGN